MATIKRINDRGAVIAWSPLRHMPNVLATGTKVRLEYFIDENVKKENVALFILGFKKKFCHLTFVSIPRSYTYTRICRKVEVVDSMTTEVNYLCIPWIWHRLHLSVILLQGTYIYVKKAKINEDMYKLFFTYLYQTSPFHTREYVSNPFTFHPTRIIRCSVKTRTRFSSIAWGPGASRSSGTSLTHGLIVGGMADGVVSVWDAGALLQGKY
jgi:hypothetical protein